MLYELDENAREGEGTKWPKAKRVTGVAGAPLIAPARMRYRRRRRAPAGGNDDASAAKARPEKDAQVTR